LPLDAVRVRQVAWVVLGEKLKWNYAVSLVCLALAVYFAFGFNRRDYGRLRQLIDVLNSL